MKHLITAVIAGTLLSACGGSGNDQATVDSEVPSLGAALTDETTATSATVANTSELQIDPTFNLASSRTIDVNFDIAEAEGTDGSVSICTDYAKDGSAFDVNYESCIVSAPMLDGQFSHFIDVTNEFDSVVAVVWFQTPGTDPLYQEFNVNDQVRGKGIMPSLVWR